MSTCFLGFGVNLPGSATVGPWVGFQDSARESATVLASDLGNAFFAMVGRRGVHC